MLRSRFRTVVQRMSALSWRPVSDKNVNDFHWLENFKQSLQMRNILVNKYMTTVKSFNIKAPFFRRHKFVMPFTFSDLAGHGSFMLLAISYLESDFLNLRAYAFFGITLSIIFQYYREKPLWIPIRWNSLFLVINGVMILLLLKDANDADHIPEEQKFLYTSVFQSKGMNSVDFLHLISSAKRIEHKKGDKLVSESTKNTRVCLVKKGKLVVTRGGEKVGTINQNQFVGAMSFLTWASKIDAEENAARLEEEEEPITVAALVAAFPHALMSFSGRISVALGKLFDLDLSSHKHHHHYYNHQNDTNQPVIPPPAEPLEPNPLNRNYYHPSSDCTEGGANFGTSDESNVATPTYTAVLGALSSMMFPPPPAAETTNSAGEPIGQSAGTPVIADRPVEEGAITIEPPVPVIVEGQSGWADVVCEEDCVVFSWTFRDLYELVRENPAMGAVLERCISEDLNKKMANSWQDEPRNRYKQLLTGALMDEEVTANKRAVLDKHAGELHITPTIHVEILNALGWTADEYLAGFRRGSVSVDNVAKYARLVKRCMDSDDGITQDDRESLRAFRQSTGVTRQMHGAVVRQLGWTLDEYETGSRGQLDSAALSASMSNGSSAATPPPLQEDRSAASSSSSPTTAVAKERYFYARRAYNWLSGYQQKQQQQVSTTGADQQSAAATIVTPTSSGPVNNTATAADKAE